ncbi:hypothetical protein CCP3SC5AM1_2320007 [Gammaproteobacteria bacterium]
MQKVIIEPQEDNENPTSSYTRSVVATTQRAIASVICNWSVSVVTTPISGSITIEGWELPKTEQKKPTIPHSPNPFPGSKDEADAPNNPPLNYGLVCVANGGKDTQFLEGGWEANQFDGSPVKIQLHIAGYDSTFRATIDTRDREAPKLWAVVKRFSPLHSQLAAYVLTKLGDKNNKGCFHSSQRLILQWTNC